MALANPHIEGTGFDLPEVGPIFEEYVESNRLSGRVKFAPGSFMDQPLPKADVVMMGHILHDWGVEMKRMLVRKAYDALPEGGAYIGYESIIDDDRCQNAFGLLMSLYRCEMVVCSHRTHSFRASGKTLLVLAEGSAIAVL